jgi:hypothetical protein
MANNKQINNHEISGKVLHIGQPEEYITKSGTTIITRNLVMEVFIGTQAHPHEFIFNQSNMGQLADIEVGKWITVNFALSGNSSTKDGRMRYWNKSEGLSVIKG